MPRVRTQPTDAIPKTIPRIPTLWIVFLILTVAAFLRWILASTAFLNPDEALHYFIANQPTLAAAYRASLTSAHPPLMILMLYGLLHLGHSEIALRWPSVIAGVLFCWVGFLWVRKILDEQTAILSLSLFAFAPSLVLLGAEVRQYSLLLLFAVSSLYFLEHAAVNGRIRDALLSCVFLWLALLTHYSALLFMVAITIYAPSRFAFAKKAAAAAIAWGAGQLGTLSLCLFLYETHISRLRANRDLAGIGGAYLRNSLRHPGEAAVPFALRSLFRLFHYFFNQPITAAFVLLFYIAGLWFLWRRPAVKYVNARKLVVLFLLPLLITCAAAIAGVYPFGGSRHDVFLVIFIVPAAAFGLSLLLKKELALLAAACLLLICYLLPRPLGPSFTGHNDSLYSMRSAVAFMRRNAPENSVVMVDHQTSFPFRYYFCPNDAITFGRFAEYADFACGGYRVSAAGPQMWMPTPATFPQLVQHASQDFHLQPHDPLWFFQTGWSVDKQPDFHRALQRYGCESSPHFSDNILVCRLIVGHKP